eukprot:8015700-Pyramimonas_sp.AAC.1
MQPPASNLLLSMMPHMSRHASIIGLTLLLPMWDIASLPTTPDVPVLRLSTDTPNSDIIVRCTSDDQRRRLRAPTLNY